MNRKEHNAPGADTAAQGALRKKASKPDPLYDKTNRNFQRGFQGNSKDVTTSERDAKGSSSGEERDII